MNYSIIFFISLLFNIVIMPLQAATQLDTVITTKQQSQEKAQKTQQHIVELDEKTNEMINEYRSLLRENAVLDAYNQQLNKQLQQQQEKKIKLDSDMANVREIRMELTPLMQEMLQVLAQFINNDIPFLWQERQLRLTALTHLLDNPSISNANKYRRIIEAYQIESEYGETIETWQAQLPLSNEDKSVQLIRIGRIGLYYLTPDKKVAGYWDNNNRIWVTLPDSWLGRIKQAYEVADNKTVPTLLDLPRLPASPVKATNKQASL